MASAGYSSQFAALYASLPPEVQRDLVEKYLIPLLDEAPESNSKRALEAASRVHARQSRVPALDLRAKHDELNDLLDELQKDAKRGWMISSDVIDEHVDEFVNSVVEWLGDIWAVAYEYHLNFELCHDCLHVASTAVHRLINMRFDCKCAMENMYIPITLKNKAGRKVKTFNIIGVGGIDAVICHIWRDLFLCILAYGTSQAKNRIPDMLEDIKKISDWRAVDRIFYGGKSRSTNSDDGINYGVNIDSDDEDFSGDDDENNNEDGYLTDSRNDDKNEDHESDYDGELNETCFTLYWSERIFQQRSSLLRLIESALFSHFKSFPSHSLLSAIKLLFTETSIIEDKLCEALDAIAPVSSDSCATALEIYAKEARPDKIIDLLNAHSHLLRLRDYAALQTASRVIAVIDAPRAIKILEKEMMNTARTIYRYLLPSYSGLEVLQNKTELLRVLALPRGSRRQQRIDNWVDTVSSFGDNGFPMAFAMMMGVPDLDLEEGPMGILDHFEPDDPDLKELREEHRPQLKQIFEGWAVTGQSLRDGATVLLKVYRDIVQLMPFLRGTDITEEMINRLQDRSSKQFVCEGLDALLAFAKVQGRKWNSAVAKMKKRREQEAKNNANSSSGSAGPSGTTVNSSNSALPPNPQVPATHPPLSSTATPPAASVSSSTKSHNQAINTMASASKKPSPTNNDSHKPKTNATPLSAAAVSLEVQPPLSRPVPSSTMSTTAPLPNSNNGNNTSSAESSDVRVPSTRPSTLSATAPSVATSSSVTGVRGQSSTTIHEHAVISSTDDDDDEPPPLIPDDNAPPFLPVYGPEPPPPPPLLFPPFFLPIGSFFGSEAIPEGIGHHEPPLEDVD